MPDPNEAPQPETTEPVALPRPDPDEMPPLMTVRQAARILGDMPERTVRLLCETGAIYAVKIGRQWRVNRDDLYRQYRIRSRFVQIDAGPAEDSQAMAEPAPRLALL